MRDSFSSAARASSAADKMAVLDVVAERIEPDFGGVEKDLRRAKKPRVSSTMRSLRSGAACGRQASHTPSVSSAVTEPASSAVVR